MRHHKLRRRYGHASNEMRFKDLIGGSFFKFVSGAGGAAPYVKISARAYTSALTPTRGNVRGGDPATRHSVKPTALVRIVAPYATHAFPEAGSEWWPRP